MIRMDAHKAKILWDRPFLIDLILQDPNLFSFMSPLSIDVWIYILTAYLAVSLILYTISRLHC